MKSWFSIPAFRVRKLLRRDKAEQELEKELGFHIDMLIEEKINSGSSPESARRAALAEFGYLDLTKENCRDNWGIAPISSLWKDILWGIRNTFLKRTRSSFTIAVTLCLCLAWLMATFTKFDSVFFRELPVPSPNQVVRVVSESTKGGAFSYLNARDYIEHTQSFSSLSAYLHHSELVWTKDGENNILRSSFTTPNFFETLGVNMSLGNGYSREENTNPSSENYAVISHDLWTSEFGADKEVIGQSIVLNNSVLTISGVAPRGFTGVRKGRKVDVWLPVSKLKIALPSYFTTNRSHIGFSIIGRLKPESDLRSAEQELEALAQNLDKQYPNHAFALPKLLKVRSESDFQKESNPELYRLYLIVIAISFCLLLVACCNISNIIIIQTLERKAEFATRLSLGASHLRIFSTLFWENATIIASSGIISFILLLFLTNIGAPILGLDASSPNAPSLWLLGALLVSITLILSGISYTLVEKVDLVSGVKKATTGSSKSRTKKALLLAQISLSTGLLAYALFSVQSLNKAWSLNPGHNTSNTILARLYLKSTNWKTEQTWEYFVNLKEHLESLPEVERVGIASSLPLSGTGYVEISLDETSPDGKGKLFARQTRICHDFFDTMGIQILRGECTTMNDHFKTELPKHHQGPLPILINDAFAKKHFPETDPVNKVIYKGHYRRDLLIKGVVTNFKVNLRQSPEPSFYLPYDFHSTKNRFLVWHIKTIDHRPDAYKRIKEEMESFNSEVPVVYFKRIEDHLASEFSSIRSASVISACLAALAILLSGIGIWSTIRFEVNQRRREIGIRLALGYSPWKLFLFLSRDTTLTILLGATAGISLAAVATGYSQQILFDQKAIDLDVFLLSILLISTIGALSVLQPFIKFWKTSPYNFINATG